MKEFMMEESKQLLFTFRGTPSTSHWPETSRQVFYDFELDDLFIPANYIMSQLEAITFAGYDRVPMLCHGEQTFIPLKWAIKQTSDPEMVSILNDLDRIIRDDISKTV